MAGFTPALRGTSLGGEPGGPRLTAAPPQNAPEILPLPVSTAPWAWPPLEFLLSRQFWSVGFPFLIVLEAQRGGVMLFFEGSSWVLVPSWSKSPKNPGAACLGEAGEGRAKHPGCVEYYFFIF